MHLTATIVKDKTNGCIHVRISRDGADPGGKVEVIEVLQQRDDETEEELKLRALAYIYENDV